MTVQNETSAKTHGVILTEAAAAKAKSLLDQEGRDDLALRIAVQPGGCAGLRYNLFFDDRTLDGDLTLRGRRVDRLRRHHRKAGLHHRQPQRFRFLRLRRFLQLTRRTRQVLIRACGAQHVRAHQDLVALEQ
jgi:hypothetical protein